MAVIHHIPPNSCRNFVRVITRLNSSRGDIALACAKTTTHFDQTGQCVRVRPDFAVLPGDPGRALDVQVAATSLANSRAVYMGFRQTTTLTVWLLIRKAP